MHDKVARASGEVACTTLFDLRKAFEAVALHHAWRACPVYGFPTHILRLVLELFSFDRTLTFAGVVADAVSSLSAILAGSRFATDILYLVVLQPCDKICEICPETSIALVVDDMTLQTVGSPFGAPAESTRAAEVATRLFEEEMGMAFSRAEKGKTVAAATAAGPRKKLASCNAAKEKRDRSLPAAKKPRHRLAPRRSQLPEGS